MNNGLLGLPNGRPPLDKLMPWEGLSERYACLIAEAANGVEAGGISASAWHGLPMTRIVTDDYGIVVGLSVSNLGTIIRQGRYEIRAWCGLTMTEGNAAQVAVYHPGAAGGRQVAYSDSFSGTAGRVTTTVHFMEDEFTLACDAQIQLQQFANSANANGWARGLAMGDGTLETHGCIELWRVGE